MERRILVNYRVDPDVLASALPPPFRPVLVDGHGVAGKCLIRLGGICRAMFPALVGLTSENAAHRVAVRWDTPSGPRTRVYIPRRDASSLLAAVAGGRLFPGLQHRARFNVAERDGRYRIQLESRDGAVQILVVAQITDQVMPGSVFASLQAASRFFRGAPVGYAATRRKGVFDRVELGTVGWSLKPLHIEDAASSFFDDPARFPPGTATLDSAFLMGRLITTWHPKPQLLA